MNPVAQPVSAASYGSVPLLARTPSGTLGELAGEDAFATWVRAALNRADSEIGAPGALFRLKGPVFRRFWPVPALIVGLHAPKAR